jgi:hypothetical protein
VGKERRKEEKKKRKKKRISGKAKMRVEILARARRAKKNNSLFRMFCLHLE